MVIDPRIEARAADDEIRELLRSAIGDRVGAKWGSRMEFLGGVLLVVIGLRILFGHS